MKLLKLYNNKVAKVDDSDWEWLSKFNWHRRKDGYIMRSRWNLEPGEECLLHRVIMKPPKGMTVDHINHIKSDNRRSNLRVCSYYNNNVANKKQKNTTSKYKGVSWHKEGKKWQAHIKVKGKKKYLGLFKNEQDAAKTYQEQAEKYFGEYANPLKL